MIQNTAAPRLLNAVRPTRTAVPNQEREWVFSPNSLAQNLLAITIFLAGIYLVFGYIFRDALDSESKTVLFLAGLFDLQGENNIPAIFSALLLLLASGLLLFIYRTGKGAGRAHYWRLLSLIFFFLALDEAFAIHETISLSTGFLIPKNSGGWFGWAWVIPYGIATLLICLYFLRFLMQLPIRTARFFIAAGGLYIFSALCLEMFESFLFANWGWTLLFRIVSDAEEVLEMSGVILFLYALLDYLSPQNKQIIVRTES